MMSSHAASSKASKGGQRDRRIGFTPVISQPKQKQKQMRKGQRALGAVRVSKGLQVNQQKITDRRKLETIAHRIAKVGGGDWNTDRLRLKGVSIKKKAKALSTIKLTLTAERWARQRHANRIRQERERKTGGLPEETALSSSSVCRLPPVPEEEVWEPVTVSSDEEGDRKEFAVLSKQNKWLRPFAFRRLRERMKLFESEFLSSSPGTGSASKGGRQKGQQDVFVDQVSSTELDGNVREMLSALARFQARARTEQPLRFAKLRRFVLGFREVLRAVQRQRARCVVVAFNAVTPQSPESLSEIISSLRQRCEEKEVPFFFSLSKSALAQAVGVSFRQHAVAVVNPEGALPQMRLAIELAQSARVKFAELREKSGEPQSSSSSKQQQSAACRGKKARGLPPSSPRGKEREGDLRSHVPPLSPPLLSEGHVDGSAGETGPSQSGRVGRQSRRRRKRGRGLKKKKKGKGEEGDEAGGGESRDDEAEEEEGMGSSSEDDRIRGDAQVNAVSRKMGETAVPKKKNGMRSEDAIAGGSEGNLRRASVKGKGGKGQGNEFKGHLSEREETETDQIMPEGYLTDFPSLPSLAAPPLHVRGRPGAMGSGRAPSTGGAASGAPARVTLLWMQRGGAAVARAVREREGLLAGGGVVRGYQTDGEGVVSKGGGGRGSGAFPRSRGGGVRSCWVPAPQTSDSEGSAEEFGGGTGSAGRSKGVKRGGKEKGKGGSAGGGGSELPLMSDLLPSLLKEDLERQEERRREKSSFKSAALEGAARFKERQRKRAAAKRGPLVPSLEATQDFPSLSEMSDIEGGRKRGGAVGERAIAVKKNGVIISSPGGSADVTLAAARALYSNGRDRENARTGFPGPSLQESLLRNDPPTVPRRQNAAAKEKQKLQNIIPTVPTSENQHPDRRPRRSSAPSPIPQPVHSNLPDQTHQDQPGPAATTEDPVVRNRPSRRRRRRGRGGAKKKGDGDGNASASGGSDDSSAAGETRKVVAPIKQRGKGPKGKAKERSNQSKDPTPTAREGPPTQHHHREAPPLISETAAILSGGPPPPPPPPRQPPPPRPPSFSTQSAAPSSSFNPPGLLDARALPFVPFVPAGGIYFPLPPVKSNAMQAGPFGGFVPPPPFAPPPPPPPPPDAPCPTVCAPSAQPSHDQPFLQDGKPHGQTDDVFENPNAPHAESKKKRRRQKRKADTTPKKPTSPQQEQEGKRENETNDSSITAAKTNQGQTSADQDPFTTQATLLSRPLHRNRAQFLNLVLDTSVSALQPTSSAAFSTSRPQSALTSRPPDSSVPWPSPSPQAETEYSEIRSQKWTLLKSAPSAGSSPLPTAVLRHARRGSAPGNVWGGPAAPEGDGSAQSPEGGVFLTGHPPSPHETTVRGPVEVAESRAPAVPFPMGRSPAEISKIVQGGGGSSRAAAAAAGGGPSSSSLKRAHPVSWAALFSEDEGGERKSGSRGRILVDGPREAAVHTDRERGESVPLPSSAPSGVRGHQPRSGRGGGGVGGGGISRGGGERGSSWRQGNSAADAVKSAQQSDRVRGGEGRPRQSKKPEEEEREGRSAWEGEEKRTAWERGGEFHENTVSRGKDSDNSWGRGGGVDRRRDSLRVKGDGREYYDGDRKVPERRRSGSRQVEGTRSTGSFHEVGGHYENVKRERSGVELPVGGSLKGNSESFREYAREVSGRSRRRDVSRDERNERGRNEGERERGGRERRAPCYGKGKGEERSDDDTHRSREERRRESSHSRMKRREEQGTFGKCEGPSLCTRKDSMQKDGGPKPFRKEENERRNGDAKDAWDV